MYSIVMMMAVSTAPDAVDFGGRFGCSGCSGYSVGCFGSCYGSSCYGSSCYGSSCYGSSCYGGASYYYSSCHGSRFFGWSHSSCHGSSCCGGFGGWSGYGCYGSGSSCYGYGVYGGASYYHSAYPIKWGGSGCYGYGMPQYITPNVEVVPTIQGTTPKTSLNPTADKAVVSVKLPADAILYADGQLTRLTSNERTFLTPSLASGQRYQYDLKVEYVRDGKPVTDSKKIFVKAGERTDVEFVDKGLDQTEKVSSNVTVIVPNDAKLIVDRVIDETTGSKREFRTPALPKGHEFQYSFRAEIVRNGKKEAQTQLVVFKAGEPIKVDFSDMDDTRTVSK